jgi:hypothetical protein
MWLLNEDEWPHPVETHCEGVVTLIDEGRLQAFLLVQNPVELKAGGSSGLSYLVERGAINCKLAPVGEISEIEEIRTSP